MGEKHIDLLVEDGDFVIDRAGFSAPVSDRQSIGQDLKHRIIETGLLPLLIGERSPITRESVINKLKIEIDKDTRLKPGTVRFLEVDNEPGTYYVTAVTIDYGDMTVYL